MCTISEARAKKLLALWILRAHKSARAHYKQSAILNTGDKALTILNAALSIVILFFTTIRLRDTHHHIGDTVVKKTINLAEYSAEMRTFTQSDLIAIFALFLVITTIFQFIFQWGQRHLQHKFAASEFSNFQRKAERYLLNNTIEMGAIHNLNREYNHITKSYGMVHPAIWRSVGGEVDYTIHTIESALRDVTPQSSDSFENKISLLWRFIFRICSV